jgi:hypothetical protein
VCALLDAPLVVPLFCEIVTVPEHASRVTAARVDEAKRKRMVSGS